MRKKFSNKSMIAIFSICMISLLFIVVLSVRRISHELNRPLINVYHYVSSDFGYTDIEVPQKGRTLEMVEKGFETYKEDNDLDDIELMITDKPSDYDNLNHRRWNYQYVDFEYD